jgi:hypothetical protein
MRKSIVPIGFIYVQLPNEKSPTEIWSWMTLNDMSSIYAGVFFRVTGGEAASFGQVQEDNAPRLVKIDAISEIAGHTSSYSDNQSLSKGSWSDIVWTGDVASDWKASRRIRFLVSDGEVRPRNMAISDNIL